MVPLGQKGLILASATGALAIGAATVFWSPVALLLMFSIFVGVGYLYLGTLPSVILLLCATFSVPAMVQIGPVSGLAMLTVMYAGIIALGWIVSGPTSSPIPLPIVPCVTFLAWAFTSTIANSRFTVDAIQNLLVLSMPVLLTGLLRSDSEFARIPRQLLQRLWSVSSITAVGIFLLLNYSPASRFVDDAGARSFALFAMFCVAWHAAAWKYGNTTSKWICVTLLAGIGLSLSRTALIVGILLVVLSRFNPTRARDWITTIGWLVIGSVGVYWGISRIEPLRERFFEGDTSLQIGGLSINAMGRTWMWETTLESYQQSRWIGQGSASVQELMTSLTTGIAHPHNDFLRILHDFGAIGFVLWIIAIASFMTHSVRNWIGAGDPLAATIHLAATLSIVGLTLSMLTDNPIIYVFCMGPFGILMGSSMAPAKNGEKIPDPSAKPGATSPPAVQSPRVTSLPA